MQAAVLEESLKNIVISNDISGVLAKASERFRPENILRYPRLDTVLMVEEAIQNCKDYPTKTQLWKSLPKKTMYQTFSLIIDYLEYSGKVYLAKNGDIIWIWNPKMVEKYMKRPDLSWRPADETAKHHKVR